MGPLCYSFWLIKNLYFPLLLPVPQMPSSRQAILSNQLRDWYWNSYCSSHTFSPSCPILMYYYMHLCLLLVLCLGCQVDLADLQYLYCKAIIIIIIIIIIIWPHPTYLPTSKICRMELCTELFYAIIPTLFLCFLLICYPYILLHFNVFFFILVHVTF